MDPKQLQALEKDLLSNRNLPSDFGGWLRMQRSARKLSYRALGDKLKLSSAYLHDLEMGRRHLPDHRIQDFAAALGITADEIAAARCEVTADLAEWIASHPDLAKWVRDMRERTWQSYR